MLGAGFGAAVQLGGAKAEAFQQSSQKQHLKILVAFRQKPWRILVEEFRQGRPFLQVVCQGPNFWPAQAANRLMSKRCGSYLVFLLRDYLATPSGGSWTLLGTAELHRWCASEPKEVSSLAPLISHWICLLREQQKHTPMLSVTRARSKAFSLQADAVELLKHHRVVALRRTCSQLARV
jgi:hypothetical protein